MLYLSQRHVSVVRMVAYMLHAMWLLLCSMRTKVLFLCCRCLEFLLQSGATASLKDQQGYSPVHYAAAYGHRHCLELVGTHTHKHALMGETVYCWLVSPGVSPSAGFCRAPNCWKAVGWIFHCTIRMHSHQPCSVCLIELWFNCWERSGLV